MNTILLFVAQQIASYGIKKGLDKILDNREDFSNRLYKIISKTIDDFQNKYPVPDQGENFAFYKSQILIEEFLKYRLFANKGYIIDVKRIQNALERKPNILKPSEQEIEIFFQTFDKFVKEDDKLRSYEIEAFHKEAIFEIYDKVEKILNVLELHLVEIIPLLEEEYREEINSCIEEIKELKPNTALKRLTSIEERVNRNSKHVSDKLLANLNYFKGICFEALGLSKEAYECFITSYKYSPDNKQFIEKACISYYFLKDNKYKELKSTIEGHDDYNAICWAIETIESENTITFIKESVSPIVLDKTHYKRIIFNNNLKVNKVDSLSLIEVLEVSKLSKEFPDFINYDNLHHWLFILNTLSIQFFMSSEIPFFGFLDKNELSIKLLELSKLMVDAIKGSELDSSYNVIIFNYYWMQSELESFPSTINNLKDAYIALKEKDAFRTMLLANSIQKHISVNEAIKIFDKYEGELDENLISLKTFCQLENPPTEEIVNEYFKFVNHVDELNIQNVCNYLIPIIKSNVIKKENLLELLERVQYSKSEYKELVLLLTETLYFKEEPLRIERIDSLRNIITEESKLIFFIALLYFENKYFDESSLFQESYLDEEKESRDLFLYIRSLNYSKKASQLKLLRLLKKWRLAYSYNDYLLRIEIELQQILKDWSEINVIAEYGLSKMPHDEAFFTLYIISLALTNNTSKIGEEIERIKSFSFKVTENALRVASILVQLNYLDVGLELLYQKAINKDDSLARMNYFSLTTNFPPEYFRELDKIIDDCYVKYEIDGEIETIHISSSTQTLPLVQKSLGKTVLETFTIEHQLSKKLKHVRILRIMNKYLALSDDIITEANSSFSNLPVESIKFESTDIKDFEKALIENFGAAEEERRKHTELNFKEYYGFKISFTELVNANFNGSFIDAYYHLISNQSDGYLVKPLKYFKNTVANKKHVIDFSSGLLFFELSEKLGLKFGNFIVSENIYPIIENLISKTEAERSSKMSVTFTSNRIIPHFYSDDFHNRRIEFILKLKTWFKENTYSEIPQEKIEIIRPLYADGKMTSTLEYFVDNVFFAQREGYILISDDLGYEKMLHINNWVTTENYLIGYFPEKKNEILELMLSYRYIGITVNSDVMYSAYINQHKEGYNHIYNYALRNLSLAVNFNSFNIFIAVDFLKKVALSSTITYEKYKFDATNLFTMLISSFPNSEFSLALKKRIEQQFNLMGVYLSITMKALSDATRINNQA